MDRGRLHRCQREGGMKTWIPEKKMWRALVEQQHCELPLLQVNKHVFILLGRRTRIHY